MKCKFSILKIATFLYFLCVLLAIILSLASCKGFKPAGGLQYKGQVMGKSNPYYKIIVRPGSGPYRRY